MEDVCQYGHPLAPGSDPITLKEIDPETGRLLKTETKLLRRHFCDAGTSVLDSTGLVPAGCVHGLRVRRDGNLTEKPGPFLFLDGDAQLPPRGGLSWMRANVLDVTPMGKTMLVTCPICKGQPGDMAMILPADGSFEPLPEDLPEWAR